jgi:hypothetical protein
MGVAQRSEEYCVAIRRPTIDLVVVTPAVRQWACRRIERQLPWSTTARGHDVDLLVAAVLTRECDEAPVGRVFTEQLQTGTGGEPGSGAALGADAPKISRITEHNAVVPDIGKSQQLGAGGARSTRGAQQGQQRRGAERCAQTPDERRDPRFDLSGCDIGRSQARVRECCRARRPNGRRPVRFARPLPATRGANPRR